MAVTVESLVMFMPKAFLAEKAVGLDSIVQLNVTGKEQGQWSIKFKDQKCEVMKGATTAPNLSLTASSEDVLDIFTGKLDGMKAFMSGKLKLSGDMGLALKLVNLFEIKEEDLKDYLESIPDVSANADKVTVVMEKKDSPVS